MRGGTEMRKHPGAVILLAALLVVALAAGCGSSSTTTPTTPESSRVPKTYTKASTKITANVGETFIIQLDSNPTTGYSWQITGPLSPAVEKVSNIYVPGKNASSTPGAGGVEKWMFKAVSKGDAVIQMEYLQAGSNTKGDSATFNVTVN